MQIQRLLTKTFWLVLVVIAALVLTIFRLSPGLAHSTTMPPAQQEAVGATLALNRNDSGASTLYSRIGGYNAIAAVVDDAIARWVNNPQIARYFIGLSTDSKKRLRQLIVDQFCEATGGPCKYTGRTMKTSHGGLGISGREFDAFVSDLNASLTKYNLYPNDKNALLSYVNGFRGQIVEK